MTQPRRVAATSVARRVAQEMGVKLGAEVALALLVTACTPQHRSLKSYYVRLACVLCSKCVRHSCRSATACALMTRAVLTRGLGI